ncbi:MAG: MBOAT family O-acyltransferase [Bacteroidota bacterium]
MIFNSLSFLAFIALFFPIYFSLRRKARLLFCLAASYFFYAYWDWRFLTLIIFSTVVDYAIGLKMNELEQNKFNEKLLQKQKKRLLLLSLITNLGFLAFFKYFNFFLTSFQDLLLSIGLESSTRSLQIILPVGISFYTFQSMSYTIDVYRKHIPVERNFWKFATYISFFPQLVAGPIVRAKDFLPQFDRPRRFDWTRFMSGWSQVIWGFFKKIVVADSLAPFVDQCFEMPEAFSSLHLMLGIFFYSFQIYCDFSGYSDIAIGLARMMGFDFPPNFKTPYFSKSFSEFWTRWHITLSSWLRDYLYIPLGGNRYGSFRTFRNLMITMLLGGLWHGASWVFVFWGFLHGSYLILQRLLQPIFNSFWQWIAAPQFIREGVSILLVYLLTCFAWVFFRSPDFETAGYYLDIIFSFEDLSPSSIINKFMVLKCSFLILFLLLVEISNFRFQYATALLHRPILRLFAFATLLWMIAFFGTFGSNAFIYFQF